MPYLIFEQTPAFYKSTGMTALRVNNFADFPQDKMHICQIGKLIQKKDKKQSTTKTELYNNVLS